MPKNKSMTNYVADWLKRAEEDVQAAEILLQEKGLPNTVCFHSHQAVEKYLKAFLAFQEKHIRKIHDLEVLLNLCVEIDASFNDLRKDTFYLSKFYIETRYPGDYPTFSIKEARGAVEAAVKIKDFVLAKM